MRYSKSSVLTIALAVAFSTVEFSSVASAQNSTRDFPWRANSKVKTVRQSVKSAVSTPARDLTTLETIATPTPSFESMPSVIYDEGKKYVRQGDTYVESSDLVAVAAGRQNYTSARQSLATPVSHLPAVKKSSLFQKTKDLTGRLNPFSKSLRSPSAYRASDWKVPSFSKTLPSFSKKDTDPITFAAVTPLPAKTSVPASLDSVSPMLAANETYRTPAKALPARDSQFKSALPTETKLTSVFPTETKLTPAFPTETKLTSAVSKSAKEFSQDFSASVEVEPQISNPISVFESKVAKPFPTVPASVRTASSLSADDEFWSPRR